MMTNYHCHSHYCDGTLGLEDYIVAAINKGMQAIGFTGHSPVPFPSVWNMPMSRLKDYLSEIDTLRKQYASRITVLKSLEVDFVDGMMGPYSQWVRDANLDYVIGSVHYTRPMPDGTPWSIDDHLGVFLEGVRLVYDNDIKKAVMHYFELQRLMIGNQPPDIIGHLDKIKMHNRHRPLFDESATWYRDELRHLLQCVADKGTIVEINTKSFCGNGLLFPGEDLFDWLRELKIPVVINSDSHHPNHLTDGFEHVAALLLKHHIHEVACVMPHSRNFISIHDWLNHSTH